MTGTGRGTNSRAKQALRIIQSPLTVFPSFISLALAATWLGPWIYREFTQGDAIVGLALTAFAAALTLMTPLVLHMMERPGRWEKKGRNGPRRPLRAPWTPFVIIITVGTTFMSFMLAYGAFTKGNLLTAIAIAAIWTTLSAILFYSTYDR